MSALAYATPTPAGWLAECPTTHQQYIGADPRLMTFSGGRAVALACQCCDAERRTGCDRDPREPQWHLYRVGEAE